MKKKVAFLLKNLDGGGAERVASNLMLNLSNDKYDKYLIMDNEDVVYYEYDASLINLEISNASNFAGRIINFLKKILKIRKIKKEYKFDVVISFLSGSNLINAMTKENEKTILSVRNYMSREHKNLRGKILNVLSRIYYNRADIVTVVSEEAKLDLEKSFGISKEKTKVIYNLYDIEKINRLAEEEIECQYNNIMKKPYIINVGRLSEQKGQSYLIDIMKKIKKSEVNLVFLGKGNLEETLKAKVKEFGLEDRVFFLGFQNNPYKFIARARCMVMTSLYEGFPNVMVEAMSCGVPIVSSDCKSGPHEILLGNNNFDRKINYNKMAKYGFLIPDIDEDNKDEVVEIAANHIEKIINNEEIFELLKTKSKKRSRDFEIQTIIKEWESIIQ